MANENNDLVRPSAVEIGARAYELWEREGRQQGRDVDYWLQAEAELTMKKNASGKAPRGVSTSAGDVASDESQSNGDAKARKANKRKQPALV